MEQAGDILRIHRHPTLPTYKCLATVAGTQGLALLDSGATASFITPELVATANATLHNLHTPTNVTFLQGRSSPITTYVVVDVSIAQHCITPSHLFYVTAMASHDILLGMDWVETAKPEPNYDIGTWDL